ncbi:MAG: D-alanyl-D-alanine carboxypeptidase/D-alanyl-D-alanine-endopeptidase [Nitriliruptoraceae bacterium]
MSRVRGLAALLAAALLLGCAATPTAEELVAPDPGPPVVEHDEDAVPPTPRAGAGSTGDDATGDPDGPADEADDAPTAVVDPGPPPPPATRPALQAAAEVLLADLLDQRQGEQVAVYVVDEHGRELVAHDADVPVLPASTMKTVTAAAALVTFGPAHRFTTRVETTAPIGPDGVLRGDLVLVGTGDPVLATPEYERWIYPARPRTPVEALADQVVAAGLTRLEGDVVGVAEGFDGPERAAGWPESYFWSFDARWADGLALDAGLHTIVSHPDPDDGDDRPDDGDAEVDAPDDATDAPPPGPPDVRIDHTPEPALHATRELIRLLEERDVEVVGAGRIDPPPAPTVGRLARVESPPLEEILRFAVRRSDNPISDNLFRTVGRARTGVGSFAAGERAHLQVLEQLGLDTTGLAFADGSGLSRDDQLTARLLVDLDRTMRATRYAATWHDIMASMGETGTLRSRLVGTVAAGRFVGKTGSLNDVQSLSGTVTGPSGRAYHLAVIANADGQARWLSRVFVDELIVLLVRDLDG